jgi:hypothetical protein
MFYYITCSSNLPVGNYPVQALEDLKLATNILITAKPTEIRKCFVPKEPIGRLKSERESIDI